MFNKTSFLKEVKEVNMKKFNKIITIRIKIFNKIKITMIMAIKIIKIMKTTIQINNIKKIVLSKMLKIKIDYISNKII
jgi:hypothetical protein